MWGRMAWAMLNTVGRGLLRSGWSRLGSTGLDWAGLSCGLALGWALPYRLPIVRWAGLGKARVFPESGQRRVLV